jgi:hypothetical protein
MKMKSAKIGRNTSRAEVSLVSKHGIWVLVDEREYFLPADEYPWFAQAKVAEVMDVQLLHGSHLRWPRLDVDLELDSLDYPEKYPLVYL